MRRKGDQRLTGFQAGDYIVMVRDYWTTVPDPDHRGFAKAGQVFPKGWIGQLEYRVLPTKPQMKHERWYVTFRITDRPNCEPEVHSVFLPHDAFDLYLHGDYRPKIIIPAPLPE